ncbi:MAG TPA: ATP-binding protein [Candidatus Binatia bacterium]|jgi:signal transduction histidine kinase
MTPLRPDRSSLAGPVARTLYDIAQGFDSPLDSELRLRRALKLLRRIVPYRQCALLEASYGAAAGESRLVVEPDSREERDTLSPVLERFLTVLTDDAKRGTETGSQNAAHLAPLVAHSHLAVPIVGLDRVLGVLFVRDGKPGAYTNEHLQLLSVVAIQIAAYHIGCRLHQQEAEIASEHKAARAAAVAENRAKDEFLAMLAHELRNPVTAIRSAMQTIRDKAERNADIQQATDVAEQQVKHLSWLLDDLLDVSRLTRGKIALRKETVALQTIVAEALETARGSLEARGHAVSVSLPEEPLRFEADPTRIIQIVGNLLDNAAKYTPRGGGIWVRGYYERGEVVLRVCDSGIGISREMLPRVFDLFVQMDPFLTRSEGGLGVGLTLARTLVELHSGSIDAHSEGPGRGSEFVIRLPVGAPVGRQGGS